jgi:hypothetical protein
MTSKSIWSVTTISRCSKSKSNCPNNGPIATLKQKATQGSLFVWLEQANDGLTAFVGSLARVLFATCRNTALETHTLTTTTSAQHRAWQGDWFWCAFAVGFSDDFVSHEIFQVKSYSP